MDARIPLKFLLIVCLILLFGAALGAAKESCPTLKEAVKAYADYNDTRLGYGWFTRRNFKTSRRYGCRSGVYEPDEKPFFNFGLNCKCSAWQRCTGSDLQYTWNNIHYTSDVGECGCCAPWLIAMLVIIPLVALVVALRWRWLVTKVKEWTGKGKKEKVDDDDDLELTDITAANARSDLEGRAEGITHRRPGSSRLSRDRFSETPPLKYLVPQGKPGRRTTRGPARFQLEDDAEDLRRESTALPPPTTTGPPPADALAAAANERSEEEAISFEHDV